MAALTASVVVVVLVGLVTSLGLAGWAFHERDQARNRLAEVHEADRRRVKTQVEQLGSAVPEAVPGLLAALKDDREAMQLLKRSAHEGGRKSRMRASLALVDDEPARRDALADWMIEVEDPAEMLLVCKVLAPHHAALAERLWNKNDDPKLNINVRFRALVALAAFDPGNPRWRQAAPTAAEQLLKANPLFLGLWIPSLIRVRDLLNERLMEVFQGKHKHLGDRRLVAATVLAAYAADRPALLADLACEADAEQFAVLRPVLEKNSKEVRAALNAERAKTPPAGESEAGRICRARRQANAVLALMALGDPAVAWPVLKHSRRPDARTALIHGLRAAEWAPAC